MPYSQLQSAHKQKELSKNIAEALLHRPMSPQTPDAVSAPVAQCPPLSRVCDSVAVLAQACQKDISPLEIVSAAAVSGVRLAPMALYGSFSMHETSDVQSLVDCASKRVKA